METRAPAVVAIVVTSDPDARFEATLASLQAQDYSDLSVLVLANRSGDDVARRVGAVAPGTFVGQLDEDLGFGVAVNRALEMIEGAGFLLLCHDDVVLDGDAVHLLVEESFRSNAGIVTPKVVSVVDRNVLIHVGQSADRFGTIVERVQPGEIDQGQHDSVRDVFVAPGGVTLIRDDLLRSIGGFDERYVAMGDDLEMCWRARIAGARIVCAPQAVVAHAERLAAGDRQLSTPSGELAAPTLSRLRRRNELRTILICWGLFERVLTLVALAVLNVAEIVVATAGRDHERSVDIREAWRSWWRERRDVRHSRRRLRALRAVPDRALRSFQARGATRLQTFVTTLAHQGLDAARGVLAAAPVDDGAPELTASFGGAFSDDEGFDELDDLGRRERMARGRRRLASPRALALMSLAAVAVYVIGSRDLIGTKLPMLGQLVPLDTYSSVWHSVVASWQPSGLGSGSPGHPGYAAYGVLGTLTFGRLGLVTRILMLFSLPIGAIGASRLIKPVASGRARLLAAAAFLGISLGTDAIAGGRLGAVVAIGAMPYLLRRVLRLLEQAPFDEPFEPTVSIGSRGWRGSLHGQVVALGFLLALVGSLSPATLVATELAALGMAATGALLRPREALRGQGRVLCGVLIAAVLLIPLSLSALIAGGSGFSIFGAASGPWSWPGIGGLIRFALGPVGDGALAWLLPAAALVPLFIARSPRLGLAARLAGAALASFALGLVVSRGGIGTFAPDLFVVLAPAATALAAMVGLGLAAFEEDLHDSHFSWRQLVGILGVAAALVGLAPFVISAGGGRWHMPTTGYSDALGFLGGPATQGHRVLWLGDPRAIPGSSWPIEPGLAWSTSSAGLPGEANAFAPPNATAANAITDQISLALDGKTVHLGQLLAPAGISDIVVVSSIAPTLPGVQDGGEVPPPPSLAVALRHQNDLRAIPGGGGASVFEDLRSLSVLSGRPTPLSEHVSSASSTSVAGWVGFPGAIPFTGTASAATRTIFAGYAPAGDFALSDSKGQATARDAFGWARSFTPVHGSFSLELSVLPIDAVLGISMLLGWLAVALALLGRNRWLDWWGPMLSRRMHPDSADEASSAVDEHDEEVPS